MGSRLRAFMSVVVVCRIYVGARPRSTSEATPVGTASPPVRRRCDFVCVTIVACVASATSLRSHNNCHMEFLCPSEGAYPLWPKPDRLSVGYAAAHTDFHA